MAKVVSLAEFRQQKLAEKKRGVSALQLLLTGGSPRKRVIPSHDPSDPKEFDIFKQGRDAGLNKKTYKPRSRGAAYGCGYFEGIVQREFGKKKFRTVVDWDLFSKGIRRRRGEVFDDEKPRKPRRGRPKLAAQRVREVCMTFEMCCLAAYHEATASIIAEVASRYSIEERTVWKHWGREELEFHKWLRFEPL
jgi:hypothetical protein